MNAANSLSVIMASTSPTRTVSSGQLPSGGARNNAQTAHNIEQGEAAEERGNVDINRLFRTRVSRLFRLMELNAPLAIISHCLEGVTKSHSKLRQKAGLPS